MASESFGCHGITRSRQGGFLERDCRCSFCRQRAWSFGWCLAVLHEARGLLGKVWVYSMWRAGARAVLTTLGQYIPTPVEWADPKGLGSEPVLSQCHWDLAQGADEAGGQDLPRRPWTRLRKRPGVHTADISEPAVDESGKDPRNSAVLARLVGACAVLMSAPWTPAPARPFSSARRRIQDDQPYRGFPPERVSQVT